MKQMIIDFIKTLIESTKYLILAMSVIFFLVSIDLMYEQESKLEFVQSQHEILKENIKRVEKEIKSLNTNLLKLYQIPNNTMKKIYQYNIEENLPKTNKPDDELICKLRDKVSPMDEVYYSFIVLNNSYSNPLSEKQIWKIIDTLKKCKTPGHILLSLACVESSFNAKAVSNKGCIGLMQINPIHSKKYNFKKKDLYNPCKSIRIADNLISDWKKQNKNISLQQICRKYLGTHSKKYCKKIKNCIYEIQQII